MGCQSNPEKAIENSTEVHKQGSISKTVNHKELLNGIWTKNEEENANFRIKDDSIYYVDFQDDPSYCLLKEDTLILDNDGFLVKWIILKLTSDSLIMTNNMIDDTIKLYKR